MELRKKIEIVFGIEDITAKRRTRNFINARMVHAYYRNKIEGVGLQEIANELGYATHSTALHLIRQAEGLIKYDRDFKKMYYAILNDVNPEEYAIGECRREISLLQAELNEVERVFPLLRELPKDKKAEVIDKINIIIQATKRNL